VPCTLAPPLHPLRPCLRAARQLLVKSLDAVSVLFPLSTVHCPPSPSTPPPPQPCPSCAEHRDFAYAPALPCPPHLASDPRPRFRPRATSVSFAPTATSATSTRPPKLLRMPRSSCLPTKMPRLAPCPRPPGCDWPSPPPLPMPQPTPSPSPVDRHHRPPTAILRPKVRLLLGE
jgi:hypothetical protein